MFRSETMLVVLALNCSLAASALGQNRPNLIFILTDDQGVESIEGPYWSNEMECITPTLNALAQQGVSFTNCRVNPNCSPTRAALMTGRLACDTGVNGVIGRYPPGDDNPCTASQLEGVGAMVTNRLGLQTHEKTIAEVLHDLEVEGYYTILIDKWHLGYNEDAEDLGLLPTQQGFDEFYDWMEHVEPGDVPRICLDIPLQVGEEHMVRMYNLAVQAVTNRPDPNQPYALFYHTITPHRRHGDEDPSYPGTDGFHWRRVHKDLCPDTWAMWGYDPGHPNDNNHEGSKRRFIQNVEAIDTVIRKLLIDLDVIGADANRTYNTESDTIVFFTADNGTDGLVSHFGEDQAKNSTFEGGIKVPLFVMGEGISDDPNLPNTEDTRLVNHVDFYDTICDIVEASASERDNEYGDFPRRGISFADAIGHGSAVDPRGFSLSSYGNKDALNHDIWRVAFVWDHYKLVCNSGGAGLDGMAADEFYDFDESGEGENLVLGSMSADQATAYLFMRDQIVDSWPTAVSVALPAEPQNFYVEGYIAYPTGQSYVLVAHIENVNGTMDYAGEGFFDLVADPNRLDDLLDGQLNSIEQAAYNALHAELYQMYLDGDAAPDVRVVDVPCSSYLIKTSDNNEVTAQLTLGHENVEDVGGDELEYRARLFFDFSGEFELPPGFDWNDFAKAQIIVAFKHDSVEWDEQGYTDNDTDTGLITAHGMTTWTSDLFTAGNYDTAELGLVDLPPHIIPDAPGAIRSVPMPLGTPVSFGHNDVLKTLVTGWVNATTSNYGVLLKADRLEADTVGLAGDQHVHFLKQAVLRLTFDRREQ